MAPPPLRWIILALAALPLAGFPLAAWIGSAIPVNSDAIPPAQGVTIMVETNGVHTGIVVPIDTVQKDWRATFPSASFPRADGQYPTHLAIGWGEREIFLHVAEWSDLEAATALRIATIGGEAVMRVGHYVRPAPSESHRPLVLSEAQYALLVDAIEAALPAPPPGGPREILRGSYNADAYYLANGQYTLANSCNTWVGEVLAEAGVEMGWWTPLAGGVMKWIPVPGDGDA